MGSFHMMFKGLGLPVDSGQTIAYNFHILNSQESASLG